MKIIIASHGNLAKAIVETAEMIIGETRDVISFGLQPGVAPEEFKDLLCKEIVPAQNTLILLDILGGTPFNSIIEQLQNDNVQVVVGFNLGMVLEVLLNVDDRSLLEMAIYAKEKGKESILTKEDVFTFSN